MPSPPSRDTTAAAPVPVATLLLDLHQIPRAGLAHVLAADARLTPIWEAPTLRDALHAPCPRPRLLVVDMATLAASPVSDGTPTTSPTVGAAFPTDDGPLAPPDRADGRSPSSLMRAIGALRAAYPDAPLVLLAGIRHDPTLVPLIRAGVDAYLLKVSAAQRLLDAACVALDGGFYLDPLVAPRAVATLTHGRRPPPRPPREALTDRELEVLQVMVLTPHYDEIARRLFVSEETVRTHVKAVLRKLDDGDRLHAVLTAWRLGLISLGEPPPRF